MDRIYLTDSQNFYFKKVAENEEKNCHLETTYDKPILMERKMECCVSDLILPSTLYNKTINQSDLSIICSMSMLNTSDEYFRDHSKFKRPINLDYKPPFPALNENYKLDEKYFSINHLFDHINQIFDGFHEMIKEEFNKWMPGAFINGIPQTYVEFNPMKLELHHVVQANQIKIGNPCYLPISRTLFNVKDIFIMKHDSGTINVTWEVNGLAHIALFCYKFNKPLHDLLNLPSISYPLIDFYYEGIHKGALNINSGDDFKISIPKTYIDNTILYIYSDIVNSSFVDKDRTNILRPVFYSSNKPNVNIENISFTPIRLDEIESIKIVIKDIHGNDIYFSKGFLSLTLHVRPIELN